MTKWVLVRKVQKNKEQKKLLNDFANKYLKPDVVLVFKIIATNVNGVVTSELIKQLWDLYVRSRSPAASSLDRLEDNLNNEIDNDPNDNDGDDNINDTTDIDKEDDYSVPKFPEKDEKSERDDEGSSKNRFNFLNRNKNRTNLPKDNDTLVSLTTNNKPNRPITMVW